LIVAEALTRLINTSPSYEGIQIGGVTHRISQFADDTQLLLKNFGSLQYVWPLLQLYELATGMRANIIITWRRILQLFYSDAAVISHTTSDQVQEP
jgi:hypothetical protein